MFIPFSVGTISGPSSVAGRSAGRAVALIVVGCFGAFCLVIGLAAFLLVSRLQFRYYYMPSAAMEPTLMGHDAFNPATGQRYREAVHDHIQCDTRAYRSRQPEFGDIVVFTAPRAADGEDQARGLPQQENILTKRVIGLPGDTIEIKNGVVYRNGQKLDEYHNPADGYRYSIKEPMLAALEPQYRFGTAQSTGPIHLGPDQLWVMGDNRNDSNDSRYWGPLSRNRIIGKVIAIVAPASRARSLR